MVVQGINSSLVVLGDGGLGKTHTVKSVIFDNKLKENDEYVFIKGYSTARGLYNSLYDNNGKLIIFDDCDSVLDDRVSANILKSALDSYDKRTITWNSMSRRDDYPPRFDFTGKIIFISNKNRSSINQAIISRSLFVDLTMNADEKIERMRSIINNVATEFEMEEKEDALSFISDKRDVVSDLNVRTLIKVTKIRHTFPESWKRLAEYTISN